jgi:hypothetical protein
MWKIIILVVDPILDTATVLEVVEIQQLANPQKPESSIENSGC